VLGSGVGTVCRVVGNLRVSNLRLLDMSTGLIEAAHTDILLSTRESTPDASPPLSPTLREGNSTLDKVEMGKLEETQQDVTMLWASSSEDSSEIGA
jgi:hypothetical protein